MPNCLVLYWLWIWLVFGSPNYGLPKLYTLRFRFWVGICNVFYSNLWHGSHRTIDYQSSIQYINFLSLSLSLFPSHCKRKEHIWIFPRILITSHFKVWGGKVGKGNKCSSAVLLNAPQQFCFDAYMCIVRGITV